MDASKISRLKEMEEGNYRLKRMYAEERLKSEIIQEAINRYERNKWVMNLPCWTQFCAMLFAQLQLCSRQSLRDVVSAWDSHSSLHYS